jgi:pimeloyl-ACP methyl ester carboxylesterase
MFVRSTLAQLLIAGLTISLATSSAFAKEGAVKPAPDMPAPTFVETNGIRMAVYVQGEGLPVVLCHGFPELAYSWRNQVGPLSKAGFRVIAPDQRGYGLTDRPDDATTYDMKHLCDDLAGMLDALKIDKAVFCGHDWGGGVVWAMARLYPDRCLGIIGVNTPCSRPPGMPPVKQTEKPLIKMTSEYYVSQFQKPGRAEAVLEKDVRRTFKHLLTRGDIWNVDAFRALPEDSPERTLNLLTMIQRDEFSGEQFLTDEELDYFVDTFEKTGFTGGLNWYRNIMRMGPAMAGAKWQIDVPCLYIGAEHDVVLRPSSANGMEDFINDFERHTVMDCGHWTQQEKPEEFNRLVIDWLKRKTQ